MRIPYHVSLGKDFTVGYPVKAGIANPNGTLRPYSHSGQSGIIPKVRVNYTDIGVRAGVSKDEAKNGVEQVLRSLSDKVKAGENCEIAMPGVGTFKHRGGVCAIAFSSELQNDTQGVTTKVSGNRLFSSSVTRENLDLLDPKKQPEQKALTITADAEQWLRNNLAVTMEE